VKDLSKKLNVTINDVVMCSASQAVKQYLKHSNDPLGTQPDNQAKINVLLPANIRYSFYQTKEDVKLENKFAAIPIRMPLISNM